VSKKVIKLLEEVMKKLLIAVLPLLIVWVSQDLGFADTTSDLQSMKYMIESLQQQMSKMQGTIEQQNLRIQQLESRRMIETPKPSASLEPQAATAIIGEAIPWLKGAKYGGDLRLRYEAFDFYDKNNDAGSTGTALDRTRNRFRMRLRWGFEKDYGDDWKVGFRLVTGNINDQTSTNQTLGNPGYFTYKNILIDRAYALYSPVCLVDQGVLQGLKIGAGKFENPFSRYSTGIVWDADVTPEGAYEQVNFKLMENEKTKVTAQATAGQFLVNENAGFESDAQIFGYQGVLNFSTSSFNTKEPVEFAAAAAFYDYTNWFQTVTSNTAGVSYLRTNTLIADDFRVIDIYSEVRFYVDKTPVTLWYDYAKNLANVGTENFAGSLGNDIHDMDDAWGLGVKAGKMKKKGDWEVVYNYYEVGANAVVAAFNDSDLGGPGQIGFTNRRGHRFGFSYQLTDNISTQWSMSLTHALNPSLSVASSANEDVLRSQVDLNYKF